MASPDHLPAAYVVDGAKMTTLGLGDLQVLRLGLCLLATSMASRDGAVPANVLVLRGLLDRVVAGAAVAGRLPSAAVLGSDGSVGSGGAVNVEDMEIHEVAQALGCGQRNVRDLVARGALPARKRGGRWTFDRLAVVELLEARRSA